VLINYVHHCLNGNAIANIVGTAKLIGVSLRTRSPAHSHISSRRYDLSIMGNDILDTYGFQIKSPLQVGMSEECRGQKIANEGNPLLIDALAFPKKQESADLFNQE
jgi:hypothetical protein